MNEEVLTQDQYNVQEEPQQEVAQTQQQPQQETDKEQNIRYFRERAVMAERRTQELENMMRQNTNQQTTAPRMQPEDDAIDIQDDTYIEGKHLKKYVNSLRKELQETKKQHNDFMQQSELHNAERQLKAQFNDFDRIVSPENLRKLSQQKPALYRSIIANPDVYDKGYAAYEVIKSAGFGINEYESQDRKMADNRNKPKSATSSSSGAQTADSPLTHISNYDRRVLTEERKEQLRRQVDLAKSMR